MNEQSSLKLVFVCGKTMWMDAVAPNLYNVVLFNLLVGFSFLLLLLLLFFVEGGRE